MIVRARRFLRAWGWRLYFAAGLFLFALAVNCGLVKPASKLLAELQHVLGRDHLGVSNTHVEGSLAERSDLMLDEVGPGALQILLAIQELTADGRREGHIFIYFPDSPKISQVPVEPWSEATAVARYGRQDNISAVPGVAGSDESP